MSADEDKTYSVGILVLKQAMRAKIPSNVKSSVPQYISLYILYTIYHYIHFSIQQQCFPEMDIKENCIKVFVFTGVLCSNPNNKYITSLLYLLYISNN